MKIRAGWGLWLLVGIFLVLEGSALAAITFKGARAFRAGDWPSIRGSG